VGQKTGPRVRTNTRFDPSGYGLTTRCIRHREWIWRGRGTSRNVFANPVALSKDNLKSVGELSPVGITAETDDSYSSSRASFLCMR